MKTALDSSVLLAIFNRETGAEEWMESLIQARKEGQLFICEVVYAELAPAFGTRDRLESTLDRLGVSFDPILPDAAWLAGNVFRRYRKAGGPWEHLIPDFLIAAHAQLQTDRLAAIDRGYLRLYFPRLPLLAASMG